MVVLLAPSSTFLFCPPRGGEGIRDGNCVDGELDTGFGGATGELPSSPDDCVGVDEAAVVVEMFLAMVKFFDFFFAES